jgi:predicted glutamine amidotransferase
LLAYAAAKENLSLKEVLTPEQIEGYLWMSTIHNDGWGAAHMVDASDSANIEDGGAPSRATTTSIYRSTESAFLDPMVEAITAQPARSAAFHLRLATPGIPLEVENQQPFACDGMTFMHNGSIENGPDGAASNVMDDYGDFVTRDEFERTGGRSDSAVFFALIIKNYDRDGNLVKAVNDAIAQLRAKYPEASYNCVLQTEDAMIFAHAVGEGPVSEELGKIYTEKGFASHIADYRDVKYRELPVSGDGDGDSDSATTDDGDIAASVRTAGARAARGIVIASTGFPQDKNDGWKDLANNSLIAVDTKSGRYEVVALV